MSIDQPSSLSEKKPRKITYTLLSTLIVILSFLFYMIIYIVYSDPVRQQDPNNQPTLLVNIIYPLLIIAGLTFTYFSFKKSEGLGFLKWASACFHVFGFLLYGGILIYFFAKWIG